MRSIEIFTGGGGLALGTHQAGFRHAHLVEWNDAACATLAKNAISFAHEGGAECEFTCGDIRNFNFSGIGEVDLLAGGPPCQPFSLGGKHRGVLDERDMIPQFVRAIRELRPRAFILENVKGLTRASFSDYFNYVVLQLSIPSLVRRQNEVWEDHLKRLQDAPQRASEKAAAYNVSFKLLNAADFGVPQTRERIFLVGIRAALESKFEFPDSTHSKESLVYDQWVTGRYWKKHGTARPNLAPRRMQNMIGRLKTKDEPTKKPWVTIRDAIHDLPSPSRESEDHFIQPGARTYPGHTGSPLDWPSKTLKAGVHGVPGGENIVVFPNGQVRYLTIREAARIQTFPDYWKFEGAWTVAMRQLGNAVPMKLAAAVAEKVADVLRAISTEV